MLASVATENASVAVNEDALIPPTDERDERDYYGYVILSLIAGAGFLPNLGITYKTAS